MAESLASIDSIQTSSICSLVNQPYQDCIRPRLTILWACKPAGRRLVNQCFRFSAQWNPRPRHIPQENEHRREGWHVSCRGLSELAAETEFSDARDDTPPSRVLKNQGSDNVRRWSMSKDQRPVFGFKTQIVEHSTRRGRGSASSGMCNPHERLPGSKVNRLSGPTTHSSGTSHFDFGPGLGSISSPVQPVV